LKYLAACFPFFVTIVLPSFALDLEQSESWLEKETVRAAQGSLLTARDGTRIYTPDGSAHYQALWTRDFFYLVEGNPSAVSTASAEANFRYLLAGQRQDGAMPDRVQADGLAVYIPGGVGNGIGHLPATDNPAFMVKLARLLCERKGDCSLYATSREALIRGLEYPRKSPGGLLWIDPQDPHSSYGFFDTIMMTGELFYTSVLQWEACRDVADMENRIGHPESARPFSAMADGLKVALQKFWDEQAGMFRAATADCNQIDIWGSAYSVYSGLASGDQAGRIAGYLIAHHSALMQKGQLRHCAPGEYWQRSLTSTDQYQNGGHWATPFGWWFVTVHPHAPDLAKSTFLELVEDFQKRGIHEWVLGEKTAVPDYVASAAQPLAGLRRCGY
jgi:hypothetical protein